MTARFAGSRTLDDRRRRRLAQESADEFVAPSQSSRSDRAQDCDVAAEADALRRLPDESIIPRAWWKIVLFGLAGLGVWGTMLSLSHMQLPTGLGLEEIASLTEGPLPSFFSTVALLLASQLSLLILWYRSRARKDFMGRYRIWGWAGAFLTVTCLCNATGLHRPAGELLAERWPINCWRPEVMFWLTPFAIGHLALFRLLGREMRHSRTSLVLWNISFLLGIATAGMNLGGEFLASEMWRPTAVVGVTSLWQLAQAMTFLVHARFVVHVTNEAGPKRSALVTRGWRWMIRTAGSGTSKPRRSKKVVKELANATDAKTKKASKSKPTAEAPKPAKEKPSPVRTPLQSKEGSEDADQKSGRWPWSRRKRVLGKTVRMDQESSVPKPHITVKAKASESAASGRSAEKVPASKSVESRQQEAAGQDESADADQVDLKNLSRKERKKLRRQKQTSR